MNVVKNRIIEIFNRKRIAALALCEFYAAMALQRFRVEQFGNTFWNNRTNTAYNTVFASSFKLEDCVGFFIAHAIEYGVYLELANDRKHESLMPIVNEIFPQFKRDVQRLYHG